MRNNYIRVAVFALLVLLLGFFIRLDYFIISPSRAVDLRELIAVESAEPGNSGSFYLVTVTQQRARPFTYLYGWLHPHIAINPLESVIPSGMDESEYRELLAENMAESRYLAQVVALRKVGFEVEIESEGVEIIGLFEDAPAKGYLEEGDKIISVDNTPVFLATEISILVQDRAVGRDAVLTIIRDHLSMEISVPTGPSPYDQDLPFLGIFIKTLPWEPVIPINIKMETGRIGGPSAGLMFVLEIMNQYLPGDLTAGKIIAGTGTIDLNENVGRIGGVVQKVVAAEKAGAEYFFVPEGNYEQAKTIANNIKLVPVETLDDALKFLGTLN